MSESRDVVVVGGGIGGLTAALALLRRGIDVQVYDQSNQLKEVGAGIQISSNGTRVLFALGLESALRGSGPAGTAGAASLEHRRNLELVRPRRQKHRALRHAASDAAPGRSARPPRQRGQVAEARRHHASTGDALRSAPTRRTCRSDIRGRQRRQGALCDRRRRHPFQGPGLPVRPEPAGVHRLHRVARTDSDGAPAGPSRPDGRHELARSPRQRAALSGAPRRADEFRQHVGARRLAGRVLVDRGQTRRSCETISATGTPTFSS